MKTLTKRGKNGNGNGNYKREPIRKEKKDTLSEMKCILEGINRVDEEEDRTTDIDDEEAKDTQSEW